MKLGLSSYTYGWAVGVRGHEPESPMDEIGLLDEVGAHGLHLVQIGDNLPLESFSRSRLKALADLASDRGIEIELGARRLTLERISLYADIARLLDAKLIRFVIDDGDYHPSREVVIETLRQSLEVLEGLRIGLENHDRFKASELRFIVDSVGSPAVGVCLDTANSLGAGEGLETIVAVLAPLTFNLHIKDFEVKRLSHMMGFTVTGCPAGSGLVDVRWLLKTFSKFSRCRTAILEQWTPPEADIQKTIAKEKKWAALSLEYLKPLFV